MPQKPQRGRLSSKGQVVIPRALRQWAELRTGDDLVFTAQSDGTIRIERASTGPSPFSKFREAWRASGVTMQQVRAMRRPEMDTAPESNGS